MGIATYVPVDKFPTVFGNKLVSFGTLTMSDSYAGESIDTSGNTVTFVASTDTITRTTGSWLDSGFNVGDSITITTSGSNDGAHVIVSITALVLTVGDTVVDETATVPTITFFLTASGDIIDWGAETGMGTIEAVIGANSIGGYVLVSDASMTRILAYEAGADAAALDLVTGATDLSGETAQLIIIGKR